MPYLTTNDGVKLYFEDSGSGRPILFIHEFSGDYRAWELQVRYFARRYRCITYNARGYPPSDVPDSVAKYSQRRAIDDAGRVAGRVDVIDALQLRVLPQGHGVEAHLADCHECRLERSQPLKGSIRPDVFVAVEQDAAGGIAHGNDGHEASFAPGGRRSLLREQGKAIPVVDDMATGH